MMETKVSQPDPVDDWNGFFEQFQNESPRAAVILGAAFLDTKLRELIAGFLIDETNAVDELLGSDDKPDRPLSAFSARIRAAYCLGLISKEQLDDLNLIRRIRNRFAHRLHDLSFDDDEIVSWCNSFQIPRKLLPQDWPKSHVNLFLVGVSLLSTQLGMAKLKAEKNRRVVSSGIGAVERVRATGDSQSTA